MRTAAQRGITKRPETMASVHDRNKPLSHADALARCLSFLADLNGSEWIAGDGPGEKDMRQRAKHLQKVAYSSLHGAKPVFVETLNRDRVWKAADQLVMGDTVITYNPHGNF